MQHYLRKCDSCGRQSDSFSLGSTTHAQDPGEGSVRTEAMQSAWKREGERQERVSGSETGSSRGKRVPPRTAEREARHRAPGGVRRRGPRRPSRKTPRARASRQTAGGAEAARLQGRRLQGATPLPPHAQAPLDCVPAAGEAGAGAARQRPKQLPWRPVHLLEGPVSVALGAARAVGRSVRGARAC